MVNSNYKGIGERVETAVRCNPTLKAFYQRLLKRKANKMAALIAVTKKYTPLWQTFASPWRLKNLHHADRYFVY